MMPTGIYLFWLPRDFPLYLTAFFVRERDAPRRNEILSNSHESRTLSRLRGLLRRFLRENRQVTLKLDRARICQAIKL
jgi:hypothetical protein